MTVIWNVSSEIVSISGVKYECVNPVDTFIDTHSSQEFRMNRGFYAWQSKQTRFPKILFGRIKEAGKYMK
jgi:hypothetical protein